MGKIGELKAMVQKSAFSWCVWCCTVAAFLLFACNENATNSLEQLETTETPAAVVAIPPIEDLANDEAYAEGTPGTVSMRRLTRAQYKNVIYDLLGAEIPIPKVLEPDVAKSGLINVGASDVSYSPRGVESLEAAAFKIAAEITKSDVLLDSIFPCGDTPSNECLKNALERLSTKAYRRPATDEEVQRLLSVVRPTEFALGDWKKGVEYAIAAVLQSPNFLFRTEVGNRDSESNAYTSYDMASRLSFFLWNSMPDDALFEAAASDALTTREQVYAQTVRMMSSPRFETGLRAFFDDFLELYELDHLLKDPKIFEQYDPHLGIDAAQETWLLIKDLVLDNPTDFRTLMTADYTFINPRLAAVYGMPAPTEDGFGRVYLDEKGERAGLLGHISFLALHSHSTATSATRRGEAVRKRILCQEIPSPPVNVDTSIPEPSGDRRTLRDRVEEHLEDPSCKGCHQLTDPIGLGLENYNSIGQYRTRDNGALIDPAGELDSEPFTTAIELGERVREHPSFAPCIVETLVHYAIGREVASSERPWFRALVERFEQQGYGMQPVILEIVTSPLFLTAGVPAELAND